MPQKSRVFFAAAAAATMLAAGMAKAQETACNTISFSDVGWTDITTTTAIAKHLFEGLGYKVDVKVLSVPVTFAALKSNDIDVFLGNWMPSQSSAVDPYVNDGDIAVIGTNLEGTKYTLAVPAYLYDQGLQSYADIAKFGDELDDKIYGIEPGNEGNTYLTSLIEEDKYGLKDFEVVESSEQGMLAMVGRKYKREEPIVFLGWEPHPMNASYALKYLPGGEEFFGGEGIVRTVSRKGYTDECPNAGKLLENLTFTLPMENEIMGSILNDGEEADKATREWLVAHPDVLAPWLEGVTTTSGQPGLDAVRTSLGL